MREVEIKIEVASVPETLQKLESRGCVFSAPVVQRDVVYIPEQVPTVPCPAGTNVLRLRYQDGRVLLTLKRSDAGNHLSKLEHELEIQNAEQMDAIMRLLGFKIIADTTKTRRKCRAGEYEICVDEVKDLGSFLEIEKMTDGDPAAAQQEMIAYINSFGIDASKRQLVGYDVLWVQKYRKHNHGTAGF